MNGWKVILGPGLPLGPGLLPLGLGLRVKVFGPGEL